MSKTCQERGVITIDISGLDVKKIKQKIGGDLLMVDESF